jgi:hypothetical protein
MDTHNAKTCVNCYDFDSWSKINQELGSSTFSDITNVNFMPNNLIPLTSELKVPIIPGYDLGLFRVSGLNVYPWPLCHNCTGMEWTFALSTVDFYVNNKSSSDYTCTPDIIPESSSQTVSFMSNYMSSFSIDYGNSYGSSISPNFCPYLFRNAQFNMYLSF